MTTRLLRLISLCALSVFLSNRVDAARPKKSSDWKPAPLDDIRKLYENKKLGDEEIVSQLVGHLDRRITMAAAKDRPQTPPAAYEYVKLLVLIAERPYPAKPRGRPEAIHKVMKEVDSREDIKNKDQVKSLLYLSLGLAGERHDSELLAFIENPSTPRALLMIALRALERTDVPIRALPRLLELAKDSESRMDYGGSDIGTPHPQRVFPVREAVLPLLRKLNVKAEEEKIEDAKPDMYGIRQASTTIKIDQAALVESFRGWLKDGDSKTKQEAAEAAQKIGGDDLRALLKEVNPKNP